MTLVDKIIDVFNRFPDRPAFCINDKYHTYRELAAKAGAVHHILASYPAENRIGIVLRNDIDTFASVVAILLSAKTFIPILPAHPKERTEQAILQSGLKILLGSPSAHLYPDTRILDNTDLPTDQPFSFTAPDFDPDTTNGYILFTSGSTGVPKGVPITYHNLDAFVTAFLALGYDLNDQDRFLQMADLTFDLSVMSYMVTLCIGACVCTIPEIGIKYTNIYNVLLTHKVTVAIMVPSTLTHLRPYFDEITLPDIRYSLFCGEALYVDQVAEWKKCLPNAVIENLYGPTEATVCCLRYTVPEKETIVSYNEMVSIGTHMQDMEIILVDENLHPQPDGERGEICLSGPQLTPGYLDDEKNKISFFSLNDKRYYRTGDIAFKDASGNYMFCGRVDHQVKIQGYRIELSEVEFHLRKITGNPGVMALATQNAAGFNQIEIVFEDKATDIESVMAELRTKLPSYMMPARFHFVAPFPYNANGKTDRKALGKMIASL